jgi:hypothetical protein
MPPGSWLASSSEGREGIVAEFWNATRGLKIRDSEFAYLTEGAYGIVFADKKRGRIRKVYRHQDDVDFQHCQKVFRAETQAYAIATNAPALTELVPRYYGLVTDLTVVDGAGKDVTNEFHADLAFEAEFVDCNFQKSRVAPDEERRRIMALFRKHGIKHTFDISVCMQNNRIRKVVDFAMKKVESRAKC